jgi:hypothetical protein
VAFGQRHLVRHVTGEGNHHRQAGEERTGGTDCK